MADERKPDPVARLTQENAELRDRLMNIEKLLAMQQPVTAPIKKEQEQEAEFQRVKAELSLSVKERTQARARRLWQEKTEYPVKVGDVPEILIPARSTDEAKGRYDTLCGILGVDADKHKYSIGAPVQAAA